MTVFSIILLFIFLILFYMKPSYHSITIISFWKRLRVTIPLSTSCLLSWTWVCRLRPSISSLTLLSTRHIIIHRVSLFVAINVLMCLNSQWVSKQDTQAQSEESEPPTEDASPPPSPPPPPRPKVCTIWLFFPPIYSMLPFYRLPCHVCFVCSADCAVI